MEDKRYAFTLHSNMTDMTIYFCYPDESKLRAFIPNIMDYFNIWLETEDNSDEYEEWMDWCDQNGIDVICDEDSDFPAGYAMGDDDWWEDGEGYDGLVYHDIPVEVISNHSERF